jgi:hypothetical protein
VFAVSREFVAASGGTQRKGGDERERHGEMSAC